MPTQSEVNRELYLDLLKRSLTNWIYGNEELEIISPRRGLTGFMERVVLNRGKFIARRKPFDADQRRGGLDWPPTAHTMIGMMRLENLEYCIRQVIEGNVPGDLIETGVWRGGSTIFMRGALKAYGDPDRIVWVADSFEGLPQPNATQYPADAGDVHHTLTHLQVSVEQVKRNFESYGLLDERVRFLKGWFSDTLPTAPIKQLAILRLDGDMYESTMDSLTNLYGKVSPGGFVIIDDFALKSCAAAVGDFRATHSISDSIEPIDGIGVYWRKSA